MLRKAIIRKSLCWLIENNLLFLLISKSEKQQLFVSEKFPLETFFRYQFLTRKQTPILRRFVFLDFEKGLTEKNVGSDYKPLLFDTNNKKISAIKV